MRINIYHILLFLGFLLLSPAVLAQDGSESMEPEMKSSFMPGGESQKFDSRDTVYLRPAVTQPKTSESKNASGNAGNREEDDDVLSFNFLYYIIQKFKMSDIVDPD